MYIIKGFKDLSLLERENFHTLTMATSKMLQFRVNLMAQITKSTFW